jgi:adenylate cyclase
MSDTPDQPPPRDNTGENGPRAQARAKGRAAVRSLREGLVQRVADLLAADRDSMQTAIEVGLVRREWLDNPLEEPLSTTPPRAMVERFLEREVERHPSSLARLGLSTLQILNSSRDDSETGGVPQPMAVVFTDLEGFTSFTAKQGDEAASQLLHDHALVVGPIVRSRGGKIVKRIGDGLLLTFPEPEAAVLASLELVEAAPAPLALRAGGHWGEPVVAHDDVIGHDVNLAARVTDAARGGEVLVTEALRAAIEDLPGVKFGRVTTRAVKGLEERVRVLRAERDESAPTRAQTPHPSSARSVRLRGRRTGGD